MAESGFYKVEFSAQLPGAGGIVILDDGTVRGGDGQYLYSGTFEETPSGVVASIRVRAASASAKSVFGSAGGSFDLSLSGTSDANNFRITGPSPFPGGAGITISGTRLAGLDLK